MTYLGTEGNFGVVDGEWPECAAGRNIYGLVAEQPGNWNEPCPQRATMPLVIDMQDEDDGHDGHQGPLRVALCPAHMELLEATGALGPAPDPAPE